jgi:hypothetical protein
MGENSRRKTEAKKRRKKKKKQTKKRINMTRLLFIMSLFFPFSILAQKYEIKGAIIEKSTNQGLPGAHIKLLYPWGEVVKSTVSELDGQFKLEQIEQGGYKLHYSFLGFGEKEMEVTISTASIDLGKVLLEEGAVDLVAVEVKEKLPLAQQQGDTTAYNAKAFKTLADASAGELISKMPGVVNDNGKIQVQGENVTRVLVDGKEFFGNDPNAALKNLPASVISKIQVFDQASDQAQFTGFDDGNTTKTINIITKTGVANAQFGKLYAGYGTDEKYQLGGNTSFFDGDRRISIIGQSNNINIQNFASEDLLGVVGGNNKKGSRGRGGGRGRSRRGGDISANDFLVDQSGGIAKTNAFGINFSDKWGEKLTFSSSYFYNNTDNVSKEISLTEFIDNESVSEFYEEESDTRSDNYNHRFSGVIEYKFNKQTSLKIRPRVSLQKNKGTSLTEAQTLLGLNPLNSTITAFDSDLQALKISNGFVLRHRFAKRGRTISLGISNNYETNEGESYLNSENVLYRQMNVSDTLDQLSNLDIRGWQHSANLSYTEPLGKGMLMFNYKVSLQEEESDKRSFDFETESQDYSAFNEALSSVFTNNYWTHQVGTGYNFRKGRDFFGMVRVNAQWSRLNGAESFPNQAEINQNFFNLVPFAMLRVNFSKQENLRLVYRTSTQNPKIQQLQNVLDNSNPIQLSIGNPNLDQSFNHRLFLRYTKSNLEKASVFFVMLSGNFTQNYIGNATYLADSDHPIFSDLKVARGTQLTQPTNLDGYKNLRVFTTYGFPFKAIKTNINLDLTANYTSIPGLINEELNLSDNRSLTTGVTFASNISEKVDFTISSRSGLNWVNNSLNMAGNTHYLNQKTSLKLGWVMPLGIVFRSTIAHQFYDGLSENFDQGYFLWNMSLGKKILKDQQGELALTVFDLLNQNQSITRNVTDVYIEDLQTNVLEQYFMLKFTWNFRNFSK